MNARALDQQSEPSQVKPEAEEFEIPRLVERQGDPVSAGLSLDPT
jgi:hypothetical protein